MKRAEGSALFYVRNKKEVCPGILPGDSDEVVGSGQGAIERFCRGGEKPMPARRLFKSAEIGVEAEKRQQKRQIALPSGCVGNLA